MIIVEIFAYIFVEIIFQGIILGIIKLVKKSYNFLFPKRIKNEFTPYRKKEKPSSF